LSPLGSQVRNPFSFRSNLLVHIVPHMDEEHGLAHVVQLAALVHIQIILLFADLRVRPTEGREQVHVIGPRTCHVSSLVHSIDENTAVLVEVRLSPQSKAVEVAPVVIYDQRWCLLPPAEHKFVRGVRVLSENFIR
jgi:hypothetical protein